MRRLLPLLLVLAACAPNYSQRLAEAQANVRTLRATRDANAAFLSAASAYETDLKGGGRGFTLLYTAADLEKFAASTLPLRLDARSFHAQLNGTISVDRLTNVRFLSGNQLAATAVLHGERITYTGKVPAAFKSQVDQFIQGVQAGVDLQLDVRLQLDGGTLKAYATGRSAKLRRNSSSSSEDLLLDEVNKRALKNPFTFEVGLPEATEKPSWVLVTANHLVVRYGR